jgi:hypothetical protein
MAQHILMTAREVPRLHFLMTVQIRLPYTLLHILILTSKVQLVRILMTRREVPRLHFLMTVQIRLPYTLLHILMMSKVQPVRILMTRREVPRLHYLMASQVVHMPHTLQRRVIPTRTMRLTMHSHPVSVA